jgi:hypothetical protein
LFKVLSEGQEMLYLFPGGVNPSLCRVTRVRRDDETGEALYDIERADDRPGLKLKLKWIQRDLLTMPPR